MSKLIILLVLGLLAAEGYYQKTVSCLEGQNIFKISSGGIYLINEIDNSEFECTVLLVGCRGEDEEEESTLMLAPLCPSR